MNTVLLVEDNRLIKIAHERLLTRAGYKVVAAGDGEEALKVVHSVSPDVILLDMMLPRVSGHQVLRALKSNPLTAGIPVVVVTGLSKMNAGKLKGDGANAFVEKEALLDSLQPLLDAIRHVLKKTAVARKSAVLIGTAEPRLALSGFER
jgi:CheY-like chemotaxis protein